MLDMLRPSGISLAIVAFLLSGCVEGSRGTLEAAPDLDDQTGLRGRVVSDEIFPVVGATVSAKDGPNTTTDEGGAFTLLGLSPGPVTIRVEAVGYEPREEALDVLAGTFVDITITLIGIPGQSPYASTLIFNGFIGCGWAIIFGAGWYTFTPCPFGANADRFEVEVGPDWRAGVHEMTWRTSEEMLLASSLVGTCAGGPNPDPCPAVVSGKNPLKVVARPQDPAYAAKHAVDGKVTWPEGNHTSFLLTAYTGHYRTEINQTLYPACVAVNTAVGSPPEWGCPFGLGLTTSLRSELYHTTFYLQEPPQLESYSALPDQ